MELHDIKVGQIWRDEDGERRKVIGVRNVEGMGVAYAVVEDDKKLDVLDMDKLNRWTLLADGDEEEIYEDRSMTKPAGHVAKDICSVTNPPHYKFLGIEPIEVIKDWYSDVNPFYAFCLGNALKYLARCTRKGDTIGDLMKAQNYIQRVIDEMKE